MGGQVMITEQERKTMLDIIDKILVTLTKAAGKDNKITVLLPEERAEKPIGTCSWLGKYGSGNNAVILSYYGGASLWVTDGIGNWFQYAKADNEDQLLNFLGVTK